VNKAPRKNPKCKVKDWVPDSPLQGQGTLQQLLDWTEFHGMDPAEFIAAQFEQYLRWHDDVDNDREPRVPHPLDMPNGAPRDWPEPPRRPC